MSTVPSRGGSTIGSILIDPNNSNRASVECASIPPTGIFPREILAYQNQYAFQTTFDPLMPSRGGVPVGVHPLDPIVLAPGFDPGGATPGELARWRAVTNAVQVFADALGFLMADLLPPEYRGDYAGAGAELAEARAAASSVAREGR